MSAAPLLAARGAGRRFGVRLGLAATDLVVHEGEIVALVGPNGAGKSTLLTMLAGALQPSEGRVERRPGARVGWMPQQPAHYGRLTPRENLELFARLEREPDPTAAADRLVRAFELPDDGRLASQLSVGNRQRLNLAVAMLGDPDVLLLDEPTAALDPRQRRRLWETAAGLKDAGGSVVLATQNVEEVEQVADRVTALLQGEVVFAGTAGEWARLEKESLFA